MGVQNNEGLRFQLEVIQKHGQGGMLEDFGVVPRVIGVTVIHSIFAVLEARDVVGM